MTWSKVELGTIVTLKRGYDLPSSKRREGNIPIYSSSGKSGSHDMSMVDGPGVITGRYGTIGEVFYSEGPYWPLNTTLYVSDFKGNDRRFIYYLLKTIRWENYTTASAVPGINRNHVHRCPVIIPDIETQHRISGLLRSFDAQVANLTRTNRQFDIVVSHPLTVEIRDFDAGLQVVGERDVAGEQIRPLDVRNLAVGLIKRRRVRLGIHAAQSTLKNTRQQRIMVQLIGTRHVRPIESLVTKSIQVLKDGLLKEILVEMRD